MNSAVPALSTRIATKSCPAPLRPAAGLDAISLESPSMTTADQHRFRRAADLLATVLTIAVSVALGWQILTDRGRSGKRSNAAPPLPASPISLTDANVRGSASATVALLEFSDFQCPYCGRLARETIPAIEEKYVTPGKVMLAFKHFPLSEIHSAARLAAEAAECAGSQGKFWEFHNGLFALPSDLSKEGIWAAAKRIGST